MRQAANLVSNVPCHKVVSVFMRFPLELTQAIDALRCVPFHTIAFVLLLQALIVVVEQVVRLA